MIRLRSPATAMVPKRDSTCQRIRGRFRFRFNPAALTDYGVETARDALEVLFRLEEGFGARPVADAAGARVVVDPAAPGAQKLDVAVRAWAAMRARRDSGEISEEEYLDWKRGFTGR